MYMPQFPLFSDHCGMTIHQIRRQKLRLLIGEHGREAVARAIETNPDYLTQLCGPNPSRNIGHDIARRVELAYGKPSGWMDQKGELGSQDEEADALSAAIQSLPPSKRAAIQAVIDSLSEPAGKDVK